MKTFGCRFHDERYDSVYEKLMRLKAISRQETLTQNVIVELKAWVGSDLDDIVRVLDDIDMGAWEEAMGEDL